MIVTSSLDSSIRSSSLPPHSIKVEESARVRRIKGAVSSITPTTEISNKTEITGMFAKRGVTAY